MKCTPHEMCTVSFRCDYINISLYINTIDLPILLRGASLPLPILTLTNMARTSLWLITTHRKMITRGNFLNFDVTEFTGITGLYQSDHVQMASLFKYHQLGNLSLVDVDQSSWRATLVTQENFYQNYIITPGCPFYYIYCNR